MHDRCREELYGHRRSESRSWLPPGRAQRLRKARGLPLLGIETNLQPRQQGAKRTMNREKRPAREDIETESPAPSESTEQDVEPGDTRLDEEKLKENREQLGVEEDHKTPTMKKGHRGTFP
jgi:hypothetical protein